MRTLSAVVLWSPMTYFGRWLNVKLPIGFVEVFQDFNLRCLPIGRATLAWRDQEVIATIELREGIASKGLYPAAGGYIDPEGDIFCVRMVSLCVHPNDDPSILALEV